ncbi:MAG: glycosyde hydrolase family 15 protein [Frankiales bacterium]|nr:glycosyde hydrolase family 15 protein [Frankiales bacterium]
MSDTPLARTITPTRNPPAARESIAFQGIQLERVAQHMYALMLRNISSDGYPFDDSSHTMLSRPGCVIAAPSYPANTPDIRQDYVFNWTRDAAITALEVAAASPAGPDAAVGALIDYVNFAQLTQANAAPTLGHACFTIDGQARPWSEQNDGPAIQTIAVLAAFDGLDTATQKLARALIARNVEYLLTCYTDATTNLWEEHIGFSFFARSVQLRCLLEVTTNRVGVTVPAGTAPAITWLQQALAAHWNGTYYATLIGGVTPGKPDEPVVPAGYDPNIDIVQAAIYGAVPCTDTKLLATAGQLRRQWADPNSPAVYPINLADRELGVGPMLGRYPMDTYDGGSGGAGDHPWALCTANFAQLYYEVANGILSAGTLPLDELSAEFFDQVGVTSATPIGAAAAALQAAGDEMLRAVVHHSDHLELSEQFDGESGYERSVRDLTWSYAAFLSAVRARTSQAVDG